MGAVADYVELTQRGALALIRPPARETGGQRMQIDAATRRNLELFEATSGAERNSLLRTIDRTATGAGARLLAARLSGPSTDLRVIGERHDAVDWLLARGALVSTVSQRLRRAPDLERAMARLSLDRGGPRDLGAVRDALAAAGELAAALDEEADAPPTLLRRARERAGRTRRPPEGTRRRARRDPAQRRSGGRVRHAGISAGPGRRARPAGRGRDEKSGRSRRSIANSPKSLPSASAATTCWVTSWRCVRNTPRSFASPPHSETFFHRQTIASAGRFGTHELSKLESGIIGARARRPGAGGRDVRDVAPPRSRLRRPDGGRRRGARRAGSGDRAGAARGAGGMGAPRRCPPISPSGSLAAAIPVVERALREAGGGGFVANDCDLSAEGVGSTPAWIVTGPNMAGKSTFLRQKRADRRTGADGVVRPRAGGAHRRGRPAVLPRRRSGRPRPGALDLHGGRWWRRRRSSTRRVRVRW